MNLAEMLAIADQATQGVEVNTTEYKPIDPGTYNVIVVGAEGPKDSKRANYANPTEFGKTIELQLEIADGANKGRKLFFTNNILVYPASPSSEDAVKAQKAMAIGANERKVILASIGKAQISDAHELIGASFSVDVTIRDYQGKKKNQVSRVKPLGGTASVASATAPAPAFAAPQSQTASTQTAAQSSSLPWFRK